MRTFLSPHGKVEVFPMARPGGHWFEIKLSEMGGEITLTITRAQLEALTDKGMAALRLEAPEEARKDAA